MKTAAMRVHASVGCACMTQKEQMPQQNTKTPQGTNTLRNIGITFIRIRWPGAKMDRGWAHELLNSGVISGMVGCMAERPRPQLRFGSGRANTHLLQRSDKLQCRWKQGE